MANPRIDELRRRLEREPGSRLFGQLAEELRKDGDLSEAIRVARAGLTAHPNYPSARMTLGRALFDTGDLAAARGELEHVLRGAPDNILASRMLAECLEGLGDLGAALLQFRAALRLAPGDRPTELQIKALEQRLGAPGGRPGPPPAPPQPPSPPSAAAAGHRAAPLASPPPAAPASFRAVGADGGSTVPRLPAPAAPRPAHDSGTTRPPTPHVADHAADFDDVFETAPSWQRASSSPSPGAEAIILLEDEAPTLPPTPQPAEVWPSPSAAPRPEPVHQPEAPAAAATPLPDAMRLESPPAVPREAPHTLAFEPAPAIEEDLSFESPQSPRGDFGHPLEGTPALGVVFPPRSATPPEAEAPPHAEPRVEPAPDTTAAFAAFSAAIPPPAPLPAPEVEVSASAPPLAQTAPEGDPASQAPALSSSTLAELYFDQGIHDKAIQVYEEMLEREPQNERARARLIEIKARSRHLAEAAETDPRAERRRVIERKIARLEEMLAAVRRG